MKRTYTEGDLQLSEELLRIAKKELHEDILTKKEAIHQFRKWIQKNEDLENMRYDDSFLMRFLRAKKFSVSLAEQTLLKYLNIRRTFPHMCTNLDFLEPKLNEIISNGYIFASPKRDKDGRRVVIINAKLFNAKLYNSSDQARAHFLTYECLMEDQETQITGLTHIGDFSGVTMTHVTIWNPTEFSRLFKWSEQSLPLRHKKIALINVPPALKWLIEFIKKNVSSKIKNRLTIYASEKDLIKDVDSVCLPQELGGRTPLKDMVEAWKLELASKRNLVLSLDKITMLSDRGIQRKSSHNSKKSNVTNFPSRIDSISGSFRKLEFD